MATQMTSQAYFNVILLLSFFVVGIQARTPLPRHRIESLSGRSLRPSGPNDSTSNETCLYERFPGIKRHFASGGPIANGLIVGEFSVRNLQCLSEFVDGIWFEKNGKRTGKSFTAISNAFGVPQLKSAIWKQTQALFCLEKLETCYKFAQYLPLGSTVLVYSREEDKKTRSLFIKNLSELEHLHHYQVDSGDVLAIFLR